jgi:hypothetical protein
MNWRDSQFFGDSHETLWRDQPNVIADAQGGQRAFVVVSRDELRYGALGLRIFDCFSRQHPTLTKREVGEMVRERAEGVVRHLKRLAPNGHPQGTRGAALKLGNLDCR